MLVLQNYNTNLRPKSWTFKKIIECWLSVSLVWLATKINPDTFRLVSFIYFFLIFFKINLFFIEGKLLYRILVPSVKPQYESGIGLHVSLPFEAPSHLLPHPSPLGWYRASAWVSWAIRKIPTSYLFYIC